MKRNWKVKYSARDSKRSKREFRKPSLCQHSLWALEIIASLSFLERDRKAEVYNFLCIAISKCSSYVDHLARAHPRFLSMKQLGGSLISTEWVRDACPLQGYPPPLHHAFLTVHGNQSTRRRTNSPTPTRRRIKSSRDVGELVVNPIQLIRS